MDTPESVEDAVEILQQLGLREYEARCFVGLTRLDRGTAKRLAELTAVPRPGVYDAIRVLEAQDLVEIQHSNPKEFRAVSLEEATETLRDQYEARIDQLQHTLDTVEKVDEAEAEGAQQISVIEEQEVIENRLEELVAEATAESVLVIGNEALVTDDLVDCLTDVGDGVEVMVGAAAEELQERIRSDAPIATVFITELNS